MSPSSGSVFQFLTSRLDPSRWMTASIPSVNSRGSGRFSRQASFIGYAVILENVCRRQISHGLLGMSREQLLALCRRRFSAAEMILVLVQTPGAQHQKPLLGRTSAAA